MSYFKSIYFILALTAYTEAQKSISIRASAFPQPVNVGGFVNMQCSYAVDQQHKLTLHWFKLAGTKSVLIWTADTSGHNAAVSPFNYTFLESKYPLSKGHAIRIYVIPDDNDYYYCSISIKTSLGENYNASSNVILIAITGNNIRQPVLLLTQFFFLGAVRCLPTIEKPLALH